MTTALATVRSLAVAVAGFLLGLLLAAWALPIAARAEPPAPTQTAAAQPVDNDAKTVSIVVYGNDPCPTGKNDEIIVCAREPESERYRIPKRFRGKKEESAPGNAWANKVRSTDDAGRMAAGLPNTCSAVGMGGQTGCYQQFINQAAQERRQQKEQQADTSSGSPQD
ncbi:hypothetical protein HZF05_01835 [Sphingomonas sp. CGMCC 1.13654]|uniref:Uncharacterized protein n=1 Tax=Sphingomonas chungangi TaxID=2683589 RepID=A0A838L1A0_9SPHN|nr:hypothetical protein [Sphingomonas chungangi]MBA2932827.1 hypothetical protein [Sphingomonas chungangi]